MKYAGAKAQSYLQAASALPLTLIFSENTARARQSLQKYAKQILGTEAQNEMRWSEFDAKDITKDHALLQDAMRAKSFFEGRRGVIIYNATDALTKPLQSALEDHQTDDALIFVQAGNLKAASKLRKTFEPLKNTAIIGLYDDPLTPAEINTQIQTHQINLTPEAKDALTAFATNYDRNALSPLLDTITLYQGQTPEPLTLDDLSKILPGQSSQAVDEIINAMFRGEAKKLVETIRLAPAQGITFAEINMRAIWRAKTIFELKSAQNPSQALATLRPPVFGARRAAIEENLRRWSSTHIESALQTLSQAEKDIRSGKTHLPEHAFLERIFLRVALLARSR